MNPGKPDESQSEGGDNCGPEGSLETIVVRGGGGDGVGWGGDEVEVGIVKSV